MEPRLKILMVASEMTPFIKTGGLADVVGALPKALRRRGHDVAVVLPKYRDIDTDKFWIEPYHSPMGVWMGGKEEWCSVQRTISDGVPVYLIEHNLYYNRPGVYNARNQSYSDNAMRYGFLCRAALQLCIDRGFSPDIAHVHDWPTALVPAYLKAWDWRNTALERCASLLTIHNLAYQGVYPEDDYYYLALGWDNFVPGIFEYYGGINFLAGGIYFADMINTVSPSYAEEVLRPEYGDGLDRNLRAKGDRFGGILNGVDYDVWSPEKDPYIPANYSLEYRVGKKICKQVLQQRFGLYEDENIALLGVVGRFTEQKGYNLLAKVIEPLLHNSHIQFVILGTGDGNLERFYSSLASQYPGFVGSYTGFSEDLAHLIEAGSDFFVMPSRFEPCGLNQIYSLRYGTLPIVRAVGGLNDTVENYNQATGDGTGFKFWDFNDEALYGTMHWAISTYYDRRHHMEKMIRNAMSRRFTWDMSASRYEYAYYRALGLY